MIAALLLFQAAGEALPKWEAEALQPYAECVMAAAKELALSRATNTEVEDRAIGACDNSKVIAQLQIESHYLLDSHRMNDDLFTAAFERLAEADQKQLIHGVSVSKFDQLEVGLRSRIRQTYLEGRKR